MATPSQNAIDLTTIRNSLNVGPTLQQQQADAQHDFILQAAHSASGGARGNVDHLTPDDSQSFKAALIETFLGNEARPVSFYRVRAPLTDGDGFAFGPPQWTLTFPDRMGVLTNILSANGMPASEVRQVNDLLSLSGATLRDEIWRHRNDPGSTAAQQWNTIPQLVHDVNTILLREANKGITTDNRVWAAYYGYADAAGTYHSGELDDIIGQVGNFLRGLRSDPRTVGVANYIDGHPELAVDIADRINQFGATGGVRGLQAAIAAAVVQHGVFDIADYYSWALGGPGDHCDTLNRLNRVAGVAAGSGWQYRTADENARITATVASARGGAMHSRHPHFG